MNNSWRDFVIAVVTFWLLCVLVFILATRAHAETLTDYQCWVLTYSRDAGGRYGTTMQAIVFQESSLCLHKRGLDRHSYVCAQLRVETVRDALHVSIPAGRLRNDDRLNIALGAEYLRYCIRTTGGWMRGVYCYNHGPYAIGSGADVAIGAMAMGAGPAKAVRIACRHNAFCGLPIQTMRLPERVFK